MPSLNEFPQKISKYFIYNNQVFPRGGVVKYKRTTVLVGATSTYIIGLRQNYDDLAVVKISDLDRTPISKKEITTVDELILHAYKAIFSPRYAEIVKGNKAIAAGIIYSKFVNENRITYWMYDVTDDTKVVLEFIKVDGVAIKYLEIPDNDLNQLITKIFNFNGVKEMLRFFLTHGLFTLDSYGE